MFICLKRVIKHVFYVYFFCSYVLLLYKIRYKLATKTLEIYRIKNCVDQQIEGNCEHLKSVGYFFKYIIFKNYDFKIIKKSK